MNFFILTENTPVQRLRHLATSNPYLKLVSDFYNCPKYLVKGGYILFDDCAHPGVSKLLDELRSSKEYKVALRNPNLLLQKI